MGSILTLLVVVAIIAGVVWLVRQQQATKARELDDAKTEARRWVERLGGQVLNLVGTNDAAKQALADAAERYTAAGSQMDQARSAAQARRVTETAYEGLYYVRAARSAMGLDPGPELPPLPGQQQAGAVSEAREVEVEGHATALRRTRRPQPALLPRRHGRRKACPPRLVLRAVVAPRAGRGRLGPGIGAAVHLHVLRHVRAWRTPTGTPTAWPPTATATGRVDQGDHGGDDQGGDCGGDRAAATGGGGDFGGGDWGGGGDLF